MLIITGICLLVTVIFDADVNAQGGAYATGVLVLMTSAAIAVTIAIPKRRKFFVPIALVFVYTTILNIFERPEGIQIAAWFIVGIIVASLVSRVMRSTELRIEGVEYDDDGATVRERGRRAESRCESSPAGPTAGQPTSTTASSRTRRRRITCRTRPVLFLEVAPDDASDFAEHPADIRAWKSAAIGFCGARVRRSRTRSPAC